MTTPPATSQETASLVKRLAGPSTGKAGLSKDQTEINRIIAEASKGSKFYENEKKKDKELTERIRRVLKQRDSALIGADIEKIESSVDKIMSELESQRDLSQIIVHVDMDAFYANVELLHNPKLEGKPFGVGYGVLTTASYEARKHGVRSGMPGFIAKKLCPDLIFVPNTFSRYMDMSKAVMAIFKRYDPNMSPAGCDEGYLNITAYCSLHNITAEECVQQMRRAVFKETKLTVSAGIAPNKMLAKICSDKNKPNGQFQLPFYSQSIISFMKDLSIRKIPGVGRVNERLLDAIGIKTCGDIFTHRAIISLMDKQFGLMFLIRTYLGISSNVVQPHQRGERKSIGSERTFSSLGDTDKILQKLNEISAELEKEMERDGWAGRTVTLKYKLDTYQVFNRTKSFDRWVTTKEDLYATGKELLLPEVPLKLRLIGLRVTKLKDLRAPPIPSIGIKRFFEPLKNESPRKKLRLNPDDLSVNLEGDFGEGHELGNDPETMPGFYEEDDRNDNISHNDNYATDELLLDGTSSKPRPPISAPAGCPPHIPNVEPKVQMPSRMLRRGSDPIRPLEATPEIHECPVCGKTLNTDNQGLNSHIDFCLSRGAILEAHAESTTSPIKKSGPTNWPWFKPEQPASRTTRKTSKTKEGRT